MPVERVEERGAAERAPSRVVKFPAPKVEDEELFLKRTMSFSDDLIQRPLYESTLERRH